MRSEARCHPCARPSHRTPPGPGRSALLHKKASRRKLGYAERMGTVINLNRYRKQKARKERAKQAETNRRLHGRTKQERSTEEMRKELERRRVDGHKLDVRADETGEPTAPTDDKTDPEL